MLPREKRFSRKDRVSRKVGPAISVTSEPEVPAPPLPTEEIKISPEMIKTIRKELDNLKQHILHAKKIDQQTVNYFIRFLEVPSIKGRVRNFINRFPEMYNTPKERIDQMRLDGVLTIEFNEIIAELEGKK